MITARTILKSILLSFLCLVTYSCDKGSGEDAPAPVITGVSTKYTENRVVAGKPVTLTGRNFSYDVSKNKVIYGFGLDVTKINVDSATPTTIEFTAPDVNKDKLTIRVAVNGKESNEVTLVYTTAEDEPEEEDDSWSDVPTIVLEGAVTETIRPGVEWTSFHGVWSGETRNFNIVRTTLNEHNKIGIYNNYVNYRNLDEKCEFLNALVGTNGPMQCCHYVRVDGTTMRVANQQDPWTVNCAFTIDDVNVVDIVKVKDNFDASTLPNKNIGCGGPLLVWNGKIVENPADWATVDFIATTHPRTAIGISKDGKTVVQVAVDGRYTTSNKAKRAIGLPTPVLARMMLELGCYKAMNFDGGGGTAMWIYGKGDKGIVNHPCENKDWDNPWASLRATGNTVYIKSDLK